MSEVKKVLLSVLLGCVFTVSVVAGAFSWRPSSLISGSELLCVPTDPYLIVESKPVRTSRTLESEIEPVVFRLSSNWQLGFGCSMDYTSESEVVGQKFLKSYVALGPLFSVEKYLSEKWSVGVSSKLMFGWFTPLYEKFAYFEVQTFGCYNLEEKTGIPVCAVFPVSLRYRNDAVSFTFGVGMKIWAEFNSKEAK